jgi:hypothetical protein
LTLWYLGYPAHALERSREAIALAEALAHPHSLAYALYFATQLHCLRREAAAAQVQAEALIALARQQDFPARGVRGTVLRGWALAAQGQSTEGIGQMRQGMEAYRSMGAVMRPYDLALLAEVSARIGQTAEALHLLAEALVLTHQYGGISTRRRCIGSPVRCCCRMQAGVCQGAQLQHCQRKAATRARRPAPPPDQPRRQPGFARPSTSLAGSRPNRWSCGRR